MSGESSPRQATAHEPLERAFGERARCSDCGAEAENYRIMVLFFHQTAAVRAYCRACYPAATEGDYHANGDGMLMDFATFVARFGPAGPPPPPVTPVDRVLLALVRDPSLRALSPANEAFARKRGPSPHAVSAAFEIGGSPRQATFTVSMTGALGDLAGDADACARVRATASA